MAGRAGETGPVADLVAYVDGLDGSERKLLLAVLAAGWPDVVEAGLEWLAEWHAGNAERYRAGRRQKAKERRRRQRAEGARAR